MSSLALTQPVPALWSEHDSDLRRFRLRSSCSRTGWVRSRSLNPFQVFDL